MSRGLGSNSHVTWIVTVTSLSYHKYIGTSLKK